MGYASSASVYLASRANSLRRLNRIPAYAKEFLVEKPFRFGRKTRDFLKSPGALELSAGLVIFGGPPIARAFEMSYEFLTQGIVSNRFYTGNQLFDASFILAHCLLGIYLAGRGAIEGSSRRIDERWEKLFKAKKIHITFGKTQYLIDREQNQIQIIELDKPK